MSRVEFIEMEGDTPRKSGDRRPLSGTAAIPVRPAGARPLGWVGGLGPAAARKRRRIAGCEIARCGCGMRDAKWNSNPGTCRGQGPGFRSMAADRNVDCSRDAINFLPIRFAHFERGRRVFRRFAYERVDLELVHEKPVKLGHTHDGLRGGGSLFCGHREVVSFDSISSENRQKYAGRRHYPP